MDAQAKKKALYRARLNAQKLEKRIDSPLVRYNESDQPVCRVCDIVLKSESLWPAHQASRKHHEAINNVKANAAGVNRVNNVKAEPPVELPKPKPKPKQEDFTELRNAKHEPSTGSSKPRSSAMLPPNFFDNPETKRHKNGLGSAKSGNPDSFDSENKIDDTSSAKVVETKIDTQTSEMTVALETNKVKGSLPEGFFDDKDADLRARGITPVKLDIKDEYKEFEKLIQDDLREVDNRLEEEEYDAAETIEEVETLEQKARRERVEMLKKKKIELKDARAAMYSRGPDVTEKVPSHEKTSSDDDSDDDFAVDWRAKRL